MQRSDLLSRASAVILWVSVVCLSAGCATPSASRFVDESYALGLKSENAKDYKAAITFYDEAINNFEWLGTGMLGGEWLQTQQYLRQYHAYNGVSLSKDSDFMQHRAYRHRANCKKELGDLAGQKADLALAEKQKPIDVAMVNEMIEGLNAQKATAARLANRDNAANQPTEDVRHCLTATYENTCKQTVELRATGSGQCSGPVRRVIEPGRMATVGFGCMLSDVTVQFVQ